MKTVSTAPLQASRRMAGELKERFRI